jgi:hypothetical protein
MDKFSSTLCIPFDETTTEQHLRHHLQDWRLKWTPKFLRLKLHCIWTWRFFLNFFNFLFFILFYFIYIYISFIYLFFIFIFIFILFIFYFQSSLCLSNACLGYCWLVHQHSLFIPLKLFCLITCFVFSYLYVYWFFPFSLTSCFPSPLTLPF